MNAKLSIDISELGRLTDRREVQNSKAWTGIVVQPPGIVTRPFESGGYIHAHFDLPVETDGGWDTQVNAIVLPNAVLPTDAVLVRGNTTDVKEAQLSYA